MPTRGSALSKIRLTFGVLVALSLGACHGKFGDAGDPKDPIPLAARPDYGPTVQAAKAPPALSGGTLVVMRAAGDARRFAVASDPERDQLHVVDVVDRTVRHVAFAAGAEPGRVVHETASDRVHVVLRTAGAVATVDVRTATLTAVRPVCPAPRGIDVDPARTRLIVVCAGGEVVALPLDVASPATVDKRLRPDLRDVVVTPEGILVTTFRSANVLVLDSGFAQVLPPSAGPKGTSLPAVAWRMVRDGTTALVVHQLGDDPATPVSTAPGGYASQPESVDPACMGSLVASTVTRVSASGALKTGPRMPQAVLPLDVASDGGRTVIVAAGNANTKSLRQIQGFTGASPGCVTQSAFADPGEGQAVALTFLDGRLVVQTREPAALHFYGDDPAKTPTQVVLASDSFADTGHSVFHSNSGGHLACASCHPEGGDDGRVWTFDKIGPRRTQALRGGLLATAPFHWDGDLRDLRALSDTVLSKRMMGPKLDDAQVGALGHWLDTLPALPKPAVLVGSVTTGRTLFEARCTSCHAGAATTNNAAALVGTGAPFQVPSLRGIFYRAPYMHDGCAPDLTARFRDKRCSGGDAHGRTSDLTDMDVVDLVAYLSTL